MSNLFVAALRKRNMETISASHDSNPSGPCALTVYHDGACPICSVEIVHYKKLEGAEQIRFVDATSAEEGAFGEALDRETALARFHVRLADGRLLSGAEAFAALWQTLPRYRVFGRIARLPVILQGLELAYRLVLPVRSVLSGLIRRIRQG